jgi:hypothetical protein
MLIPQQDPPAVDIPAEILARIIHWAIGGPGYFVDTIERATFLQLRQVSHFWRNTSFTTPHLWRHLRVAIWSGEFDDPCLLMPKFQARIYEWFKRGGEGANVHLEFEIGAEDDQDGRNYSYKDWPEAIWGEEELPYKLTTVWLRGDIVGASDIHVLRSMACLRNFTITTDASWETPETGLVGGPRLPLLESLRLNGPPGYAPWSKSICHPNLLYPNLRSLFLSFLELEQRSFTIAVSQLPLLEEFILHNSVFNVFEETPKIVNTSVQTLICPSIILLHWPTISLVSLKYFKLIRNRVMTRYSPAVNSWVPQEGEEDDRRLLQAAGVLAKFKTHNLTIDLTSVDAKFEDLIAFVRRFDSLETLVLDTAEAFLAGTSLAHQWSCKPNIRTIVVKRHVLLPLYLSTAKQGTSAFNSSGPPAFVLIIPHKQHQPETTHLRCSYSILNRQVTFDVNYFPQWKVDLLIEDSFPIRNHEYHDLLEEIVELRRCVAGFFVLSLADRFALIAAQSSSCEEREAQKRVPSTAVASFFMGLSPRDGLTRPYGRS